METLSKQGSVRHQLLESQLPSLIAELSLPVLIAAIAVEHVSGRQLAPAMGHAEGIHDEFGAVVICHGVAGDLGGAEERPSQEAR